MGRTRTFTPGDPFGRYRIVAVLGRGGMGEVYVAYDESLERRVALKILLVDGEDPERATARLLREARAAAAIDHPNAVRIFDVGEACGVAFLSMELLEGRTLRSCIGDDAIPLRTRVSWLASIARALHAAHTRNLVHRDVKPENVFVCSDGVVKVLDFGTARGARSAGDASLAALASSATSLDQAPAVEGTLVYMAPEQLRNEAPTGALDQWALGVVAYELLAGAPPWDARLGTIATVSQILSRDPEPLASRAPATPGAVADVVMRALRKAPGERFVTLADFADALGRAAVEAPQPARGALERSAVRALLAIGGAAVMAVAASLSSRALRHPTSETSPPASQAKGAANDGPPDYGSQMSTSPAALAEYRRAVQAIRDAAHASVVIGALNRALAADPDFAAAHLRSALVATLNDNERDDRTRAHVEEARRRRLQLGTHDRALLDAIEPWFRVPPDMNELRQRFARLAAGEPDAEFALWRCWFLRADAPEEALSACQEAERADASLAVAYLGEGFCHLNLGDAAAERRAFDACIARSPEATRCLHVLADIDIQRGECDEAADLARRLVVTTPDDSDAYLLREHSVYATLSREGKDMATYRAALAEYASRAPDDALERSFGEAGIAVAEGRLAEAAEIYRSFAERAAEAGSKLPGYIGALEALLEIGDGRAVIDLSKRWLSEEAAWSRSAELDGSILGLGSLYLAGATSRSRFERERTTWLEGQERRGSGTARYVRWLRAFGHPVASAADAREAVEAMARFGPFPARGERMLADATVGHVLLRAGRAADAIAPLRAAANSCPWVWHPLPQIQAMGWLGEALVQTGDQAGACEAFGRVLRHWDAARGSVTANLARRERSRLACGR